MTLRENIDLLREFMQGGSSYPGPEPGSTWSASMSYPPSIRQDMFGNPEADDAEKKRYKDKSADKRAALRKLALWVQQKGKR